MKGYVVNDGYMGYVNGKYMLFSCEEDYREYMSEEQIVQKENTDSSEAAGKIVMTVQLFGSLGRGNCWILLPFIFY